ncbi:LPXTG cell wall anchor domain-containing protein [Paractinoplanes atraurantiacus]|uniref:LPXTG-motif cell wall anchor domain-containing protein/conserved repeat domain-containing protein n=1 Tax=Paractinoplanes atraurantiacus TaxID=1036182 RepID=A0A285J0L0_9ACTN|nr:LPXTG cell wall anchor domain-containing protein [Actinoplanes atraurantiacus]SNY53860.1 LPXTG-motif cell wall anchor domain-containing protein/conserved repeat domain-containing protein [Actinoplanes atraurantiacus]
MNTALKVAAVIAAAGLSSAGLFAASPAVAADLPDLKVTVAVTPAKASYAVGDAITTTFTITNAGGATAKNVRDYGGDGTGVDRAGGLNAGPFDLGPGESRDVEWKGVVNQAAYRLGHASGAFEFTNDAGEANRADNIGRYRFAVPGGRGVMEIKAFIDVRNDWDSEQPGLAGAEVIVSDDATGAKVTSGKTDAKGLVRFTGLAPQDYQVGVTGWKLRGDDPASTRVQVQADQVASAVLAILPGSEATTGPSATASPSTSASASPSPSVSASAIASASPAASASPTDAAALPITGSSSGPLFAVGAAVLVAGGLAVAAVYRRRRRFIA